MTHKLKSEDLWCVEVKTENYECVTLVMHVLATSSSAAAHVNPLPLAMISSQLEGALGSRKAASPTVWLLLSEVYLGHAAPKVKTATYYWKSLFLKLLTHTPAVKA